jgi:hypothetical protein
MMRRVQALNAPRYEIDEGLKRPSTLERFRFSRKAPSFLFSHLYDAK